MTVIPIRNPLPGEHLAATWPVMRPNTGDLRDRLDLQSRMRLRFWSGRALTANALEMEQDNRSAHASWRGRAATPGIVRGLEVALEAPATPPEALAFEGHFIHVWPGHGVTALGDDVTVPRQLRVALEEIPLDGLEGEALPWAAVLLLRPAEFRRFDNQDPHDPCELDPSRDAFADERRQDAALLRLVPLPAEWETLPELGDPGDPRRRNRLVYWLFNREAASSSRQLLRHLENQPPRERWKIDLRATTRFPWELEGVPIALLSSEIVTGSPVPRLFLDRGSVARPGGQARFRPRPAIHLATAVTEAASDPPGAGTAALWRARVDQFAEHFGALEPDDPISEQAQQFQFLPPAGLLPKTALRILTTAEAHELRAPDRAAVSRFFPTPLTVEAVPVPIEELDSALASSAPLAPFDLATNAPELVRMLVPLPLRVFDPRLLVVETEDPLFARQIGRLVAERQDWRQRRDLVRNRQDYLQELIGGPRIAPVLPPLEPGQLEPEPIETIDDIGITEALLSPVSTRSPWEISVDFAAPRPITADTILFVRLRIDAETPPGPVEVVWRRGGDEFSNRWATAPDYPIETLGADGQPLATPLWLRFTILAGDIGLTDGELTGFTLRLAHGRVALSHAGQLIQSQRSGDWVEDPFWRAQDRPAGGANRPAVRFVGGDWTRIQDEPNANPMLRNRLLAPFEEAQRPTFQDDETLDDRLDELDTRLRLPEGARVRDHGLNRVIADLEARIKRGDDSVDLGFLKTQANVHRLRQVILGNEAANELLTSPVLNSLVDTKSARLSTEALLSAYKSMPDAQSRTSDGPTTISGPTPVSGPVVSGPVLVSGPTPASGPTLASRPTPGGVGFASGILNTGIRQPIGGVGGIGTVLDPQPGFVGGSTAPGATVPGGMPIGALAGAPSFAAGFTTPVRDDVVASEPIIGKPFELRTLSFAKRFDEGATRKAFSFADAGLRDALGHVFRLDLGFEDDAELIPDATDENNQPVSFERLAREGAALIDRLQFPGIGTDDDSSAILSISVRRADAAVLILRRFEFHLARLRATLTRAEEVLAAVRAAIAATSSRLLTLNGRLAEARHDVSVARALRREEQDRVAAINERRDALIREEVQFLAFVRPRAVDPARRASAYWRLEPADAPAPVPACLQQHDEPPDPLRAYIQLFHHAPARWFTAIAPRLRELNTREKLSELIFAARQSAGQFVARAQLPFVRQNLAVAPLAALQSAYSIIEAQRSRTAALTIATAGLASWSEQHRSAEQHASVGDIIEGRHGHSALARAAALELERIEGIATCLHAEFAAAPPLMRLAWVERYSQFDKPAPLNQLTALPQFGSLPRDTRRRFQEFVDWLFGRVPAGEREAFNLINDLVRICLLLASHAPVKKLIAGRVPRPIAVGRGVLIPLRPIEPSQVRVGMEFQIWRGAAVVARGHVEDLRDEEVTARIEKVEATATTIDPSMSVQFQPALFARPSSNGKALHATR